MAYQRVNIEDLEILKHYLNGENRSVFKVRAKNYTAIMKITLEKEEYEKPSLYDHVNIAKYIKGGDLPKNSKWRMYGTTWHLWEYGGINLKYYIDDNWEKKELERLIERYFIGIQLCDGLYYFHKKWRTHGDLHAMNVVCNNGIVKYIDFSDDIDGLERRQEINTGHLHSFPSLLEWLFHHDSLQILPLLTKAQKQQYRKLTELRSDLLSCFKQTITNLKNRYTSDEVDMEVHKMLCRYHFLQSQQAKRENKSPEIDLMKVTYHKNLYRALKKKRAIGQKTSSSVDV